MDWLFKGVMAQIVVEVLLVFGGAAALAYAKRKIPEHAPTLAYGALGAICVSILIFTFTGRAIFSKGPPPPVTPDNVVENVKAWAENLGMSIGPSPEPVSDAFFTYRLSLNGNPYSVDIFRTREKTGYLQFRATIAVADEHQRAFKKMEQAKISRILEELSVEVERANLGCSFAVATTQNTTPLYPTEAVLQRGVPISALNEQYFGDTFDQLTRGSALVSSLVRLAAADSARTGKSGSSI